MEGHEMNARALTQRGVQRTGCAHSALYWPAIAFGLTAMATLLLAAPAAQAKFGFVTKWGKEGSGNGQFVWPNDVATDRAGNVYVADGYPGEPVNHRVQKFTSNGRFLGKWGGPGSGQGRFCSPSGIATDAAGNVYVADTCNSLIQKFTRTGAFITQWAAKLPWDVETDALGNVYASSGTDSILKFSSGGRFLTKWGTYGTANGQFNSPQGVATDPSGNVYVSDGYNERIQKFTANGTFITKWGRDGSGNGEFDEPEGIATDRAGNVYVSDPYLDRIQKFTSTGRFLMKWGSVGSRNGQFSVPNGLATDRAGNVYVADTGNDRIQKFGRVPVVRITQGPDSPSASREATFRFRSDEPGSKFRCKLDDGEWKPCSSPHRVRGLATGKHVFRVRGRVAGNAGKPARWGWRVTR
jgi:sugar lactone lactonase YvrE